MNVKGRAKYEIVIVVIVVVLTIALAIGLYASRSKVDKSKTLVNELQAMRTAVGLYMTVNKAIPPNLETLVNMTYRSGDGSQLPYLVKLPTDKEGKLVDPFGKPYQYDAKTGYVSSITPGYEKW